MPAVAGLAAVLIALFALLLIEALVILGKVLSHVFPSFVPGIPALNPRKWIEAGVGALQAIVQWIIGDVIRPMVNLVLSPVLSFLHWITSVEQFMLGVLGEIHWIVTSGIPDAVHALTRYAHGLYVAAEHYARRIVDAAVASLDKLISLARSYAHSLYVAAEHYARRIVDAATATLTALVSAAETYAHNLYVASEHYARRIVDAATSSLTRSINAVEAELSTVAGVSVSYIATQVADGIRAAEAYTSTAVAAVIQVVDVDAIKPLVDAWDGIIIDIGALQDVIATDLPDIGAAVRAIPRAVPTDLAAAMSIVGAISIPMLRYMTRCGIPNCRNLSQIGRDLAELGDAIAAGAFLALLVGLASDPVGTAHWLNDNVGGIAADAIDGAKSILGV